MFVPTFAYISVIACQLAIAVDLADVTVLLPLASLFAFSGISLLAVVPVLQASLPLEVPCLLLVSLLFLTCWLLLLSFYAVHCTTHFI